MPEATPEPRSRLLTTERLNVYLAIEEERARQNEKFPNDVPYWRDHDTLKLAVLAEKFGEVAKAVVEGDPQAVKAELIQVIAVGVKWLEAINAGDAAVCRTRIVRMSGDELTAMRQYYRSNYEL